MKNTIIVDGKKWFKASVANNTNRLFINGVMYAPEPEEETLDDITDKYSINYLLGIDNKFSDKIGAIHRMILVADYLNEGWEPDWEYNSIPKYCFCLNQSMLEVTWYRMTNKAPCYFKDEETAFRAIKILGEELIRKALS